MTCTYTPNISPRQAAVRRTRASGHAWPLAHRPEAAKDARKITQEVLAQWRVAGEAADSVLLTVSELVTNAVEHAQPPLHLGLICDPGTRRVHIEVSDGGPSSTQSDWAASRTRGEHGRGLQIIDQLTAAHGDREEPGHAIHWAEVNSGAAAGPIDGRRAARTNTRTGRRSVADRRSTTAQRPADAVEREPAVDERWEPLAAWPLPGRRRERP